MDNVSCDDQLCSVKYVPNVQIVARDLPVGVRLNQFYPTALKGIVVRMGGLVGGGKKFVEQKL